MKPDYMAASTEFDRDDAATDFRPLGAGQATANLARAVDEISSSLGASAVTVVRNGDEHVTTAQHNVDLHGASVIVSPGSVEDVQSLVRVAVRCKCQLTRLADSDLSQHSRAPTAEIIVDLCRMTHVIAVDDARAFAIVEPGVTYFDLYEHLRAGSHDLMMSVPDDASVSVLDHILRRSSLRKWRRGELAEACGLEVVLSSGEVVRTGNVFSHYFESSHIPPYDDLEALLATGDLGIVTKVAVRLARQPIRTIACSVRCADEESLLPLLNATRRLIADGVCGRGVAVTNLIATAARFSERTDWYNGEGPIPEALLEKIVTETSLGRWELRFALVGSPSITEAQLKESQAAYAEVPALEFEWHEYEGGAPGDTVRESDKVQAGIPPSFTPEQRRWYGAGSGQIEFTFAALASTDAAVRACNLVRASLEQYGLDYHAELQLLPDVTLHRCVVAYPKTNLGSREHARKAVAATLKSARNAGFVVCHTNFETEGEHEQASPLAHSSMIRAKILSILDPYRVFSGLTRRERV